MTISAAFPPAQAAQQTAIVKLEEFSLFLTQTDVQTPQAAATTPAVTRQAPAQAAQAAPAPQAFAQPAAPAAAPAAAVEPNLAAFSDGATQTAASTPQQELAQLDQTLRRLGVDPHSISLFNRMGMLLYANDPAALQNLIQALQAVDQQLGKLGQLAAATNAANQPQAAAKDLLPPAIQVQPDIPRGIAQFVPEPLIHLRGTTPALAPPATPAQLEGQAQKPAGNAVGETFATQLTFSDVQATFQEQTAQGSSSNQAPGNGATNAPSAQTNNFLVNFQELQLTFQAFEVQATQQPQSDTQGPSQGLNIRA